MTSEARWSEDKGRVDGELKRLDLTQREMRDEISDMNGELNKKLNANGITLAVIENNLNTLIKANGKGTGVTRGQVAIVIGVFGLIEAGLRYWG